MPLHADGYLIPFTAPQIAAMEIKTFGVRDGSHPTETRRVDENTMVRTFFVKWAERYNFVELVMGDSVLWTDSTGTPTVKLSRLIPDTKYGRHPTFQQIMATRIEYIKGHGVGIDDINQFPAYATGTGKAEVQVFYEQFPAAIQSDAGLASEKNRYTSRGQSAAVDAESFTMPGGAFKLTKLGGGGAHGSPVPINISFTRPVQRFTTTWHLLPNNLYISGGALFERLFVGTAGDGIPFVGCVNKEVVEFPSIGTYQPGQLLLEGVDDRRITSPLAGSGLTGLRWDVSFKWAYTSRGWLDIWHFDPGTPANSGYYRLSVDGTYYAVNAMPDNKGLYNCRDMSLLWSANPP